VERLKGRLVQSRRWRCSGSRRESLPADNGHRRGFPESYKKIGTGRDPTASGRRRHRIVVFVGLHLMLNRTRSEHISPWAEPGVRRLRAGIRPLQLKLTRHDQRACRGIGGLIVSSRLDAGNGLFGADDLLAAVAAVVIGGTSLFGGVGSVVGTASASS
jgi:hypothetical protein